MLPPAPLCRDGQFMAVRTPEMWPVDCFIRKKWFQLSGVGRRCVPHHLGKEKGKVTEATADGTTGG